jgi:glycosidase
MKNKYNSLKQLLILGFLWLGLGNSLFAQKLKIEHLEPHFWWAGMEHHELEVMIHAKNVANYSIELEGMRILGITKTENPNYQFVKIETLGQKAGIYNFTLKQGKKVICTIPYELKERTVDSKLRSGFSSADVVYLLMPDRFANGLTANDSHPQTAEKANRTNPGGRHGGDIQGIINHLDYIKELGATAIWSTPMMEDNDSSYSYHTYGQSDIYKIDPRYGSNQDYVNLVTEAHNKGLKMIMDVVPNHWGSNHWMMNDLPTYTWLHQFPGYAQTNYRMASITDPNRSEKDKILCEDGWFVRSMPDLNQSNPLVLTYLIQNTIFWIEYADLDGLRVDTYSYNNKEGIALWTKAIMNEYPNFNIVGEVWMSTQAQNSYWQKDSPLAATQSYNSYLPSVMDFTLQEGMMKSFSETTANWNNGLMRFYDNLALDFVYKNPNNLLIFSENHDTQRFNEMYSSVDDYKLMMTLLATSRGIPQIYYGSELGMKGNKDKGDADIRRDFPGGWPNDKQNAFIPNGTKNENLQEGRTAEQEAYFSFAKKLLNWRLTAEVIHKGQTVQFVPQNNVYVYFRKLNNQKVMVVMNNSLENQTIDLNRFSEELADFHALKEVISGNVIALKNQLTINSKSALIIELEKN